jgi:hypothetical protein
MVMRILLVLKNLCNSSFSVSFDLRVVLLCRAITTAP